MRFDQVVGHQAAREDADSEAGPNGGQDAVDAAHGAGDPAGAAGVFECLDAERATETRRMIGDERNRLLRVEADALGGRPYQPVPAHELAVRFVDAARAVLDVGDIEVPGLDPSK